MKNYKELYLEEKHRREKLQRVCLEQNKTIRRLESKLRHHNHTNAWAYNHPYNLIP